jgi:hypothetical protein
VYFSVSVTPAACELKLKPDCVNLCSRVSLRKTTIKFCGGAVNCVD